MDGLSIKTFCLGDLFNNCYLIFHDKTKKAFMVDSPAPADEVVNFIRSQNLNVEFIALTHAHFDHIKGLESFPYPFYIHQDEEQLLKDPQANGSVFFDSSIVVGRKPRVYKESEPLCFDNYSIEVIPTPGHTPGSVSLKLGNWLFSGDTLFLYSIGRTDIPLASQERILKSIKEKLLVLPSDTIVYPGHGDSTTIAREAKLNPFL